ncbi:hypothetical protein O6H91_01G115500 [Diphasiastrum complanatum]|uniref:Uncharacterized protein n=1 Tax=Diphasiastrum complanatum TaxID=34168 RepID=A0ACC2EUV3_DIPCM|nr:hypothetical protein O6H91_01G115500 [Diphasiastrum complanatum]
MAAISKGPKFIKRAAIRGSIIQDYLRELRLDHLQQFNPNKIMEDAVVEFLNNIRRESEDHGFTQVCNVNIPITEQMFGDTIGLSVDCDIPNVPSVEMSDFFPADGFNKEQGYKLSLC